MVHDLIVVGGGVVGIATARALLQRHAGLSLALLEKEPRLAAHQTSHNSGVIHSGLYYKPGSHKARTCVQGAAEMLEFCREHGVKHAVVGKVVVATTADELPRLDELERRGRANGVPGLRRISPAELAEIEPHASGIDALHVPGAAIVDYGEVSEAIGADVSSRGGELQFGVELRGIVDAGDHYLLQTTKGEWRCRSLVTCAGLQSDRVAGLEVGRVPARIVPFRGEYYELVPERHDLVRGLIYPVPDPRFPFLGVHFTRMVHGGVEAGPNAVLAWRREGYTKGSLSPRDLWSTLSYPGFWRMAARHWRTAAGEVHRSWSRRAFAKALQRLVPAICATDLRPGGAGVRAQALLPNGGLVDDFLLIERPRAVHVCNAPSPAATACLAIGAEIAGRCARLFER